MLGELSPMFIVVEYFFYEGSSKSKRDSVLEGLFSGIVGSCF